MAEDCITNCHVHTFTAAHVPRDFPHRALRPFKVMPFLIRWMAGLCRVIGQHGWGSALDRLYRFQTEAGRGTQAEVMDRVIPHYPRGTRFVVLPMDMEHAGHGAVERGLEDQLRELKALRDDPRFGGAVIPFVTVDPRRPGAGGLVRRWIEDEGFRGLKLYPRLGYPPDHPVLMDEVYPLIAARGLPVMTHCSRGGVAGRGIGTAQGDAWSAPEAWLPVRDRFPDLRVCLAHFGGMTDWRSYVDEGIDPRDAAAQAANWQVAIRKMIEGGDWPNLWTDISYTLFQFEDFAPFLKIFLQDERLAARVLFGSDFYMTRQEVLSERAVCFRLRVALGEELFRRIAIENPRVWLGEAAQAAG
ncbi:MAG: amidohydrolase [Paracoccaceae bacterium]|nr:MAG: amidohydrolase [Paracoccaceae bacterium]